MEESKKFELSPRLKNDTFLITELELCTCLLMNNSNFPWVILVPRKPSIEEIIDLSKEDQQILLNEINLASKVMKKAFSPYKLNIGALGNVVRQLHIHIIARFQEDIAWPGPVWGNNNFDKLYTINEKNIILTKIKTEFEQIRGINE